MPRKKNLKLRHAIQCRADDLQWTSITRGCLYEKLSEEFKRPVSVIRYYMRGCEFIEPRRKYSDAVRNKVAIMTLPEIKDYAKKMGKPWHRLYQISLEERHGRPVMIRDLQRADRKKAVVEQDGFFSFGRRLDLTTFDLTVEDVRTANKELRVHNKWGMGLEAPNYLVHKKTGRRFPLNYQDQVRIVRHPVEFVIRNAKRIGAGWEHPDPLSPEKLLDLD